MRSFVLLVSVFTFAVTAIAEDRTFDGVGNNLENVSWGAAETNFMRIAPPDYNSRSSPTGSDLPNARVVSNILFDQNEEHPNTGNLSGYVYAFGQFISHDMQETISNDEERIGIEIPFDDLFFEVGTFPLTRSEFDPETGRGRSNPRQQINFTSSFIDASHIYSASESFSDVLRGGPVNPTARLRTSNDINGDGENFLPRNAFGPELTADFIAGDARVNDNVVLTSLHTVFMREHNRLIDNLSAENPEWSGEQLFQRARKFIGAQLQAITYNEFLPALIGESAPDLAGEYDPTVNPGITNEFATVFLRIGHSMLTPTFKRVGNDGTAIEEVELQNVFFNPGFLDTSTELELLLKGLSTETQEQVDLKLVDAMRFAMLGAIDIQRARDHGLSGYNEMRDAYGLGRVDSFAEITTDEAVQQQLAEVYGDVDSVEAFVGALAEDHAPGANLGPLAAAVYAEQFTRVRDGDRFWYSNDDSFSAEDRALIESTTLRDVIQRNSGLTSLPSNVFFVPQIADLDCDGDGVLAFSDLECSNEAGTTEAIVAQLGLPTGDLNGDGTVSFPDFLILSSNFSADTNSYIAGDIDGSGKVGFGDFLELSGNFGTTAANASVPEPESNVLLLFVMLIGLVRYSRRGC